METSSALAAGAATMSLKAASMAERDKQNEFAKNVEKYGFTYERFALIPFVLETSGAWGPKAKKFWRVLMGIFKSEVAERRVPGSLLTHKDHKSECTWNAFTLNCLFPMYVSFKVRKRLAEAVYIGFGRSSDHHAHLRRRPDV